MSTIDSDESQTIRIQSRIQRKKHRDFQALQIKHLIHPLGQQHKPETLLRTVHPSSDKPILGCYDLNNHSLVKSEKCTPHCEKKKRLEQNPQIQQSWTNSKTSSQLRFTATKF